MSGKDIFTEGLKNYFGFSTFKENQRDIIENIVAGNDTFVLMPTGGGKSLCYQLPALLMDGIGIVVSPLIALMKNQVDTIRGISLNDGIAHYLNSTLKRSELLKVKSDIEQKKTKLLYVAPETLTKEDNVNFLRQLDISFYAIDEAHCISEWGHDFRPEYRRLKDIIGKIGQAPIMALTATATPKVQHDIQKILGVLDAKVFRSSFNRENLFYEILPKKKPVNQIIQYIKKQEGKSGIIYCLSRKKVEEIAETLQLNGIKAVPYHAGLEAKMRAANQDLFLNEEVDVVIATIAFGMGIDKPNIRYVIHYEMPKSLEGYYQETGRAGRDGGEGHCLAFYSYKDIQKLENFMQNKPIAEQEIGRELILETISYVETSTCRRKTLLNYFGEKFTIENCGTCDNCKHPKKLIDAREDVVKLIQVILAVNEKFKASHISEIITGTESTHIKTYKHHELEVFGIGKENSLDYYQAVIRFMLIERLLIKDIENYGLLKLTDLGRDFAANPTSFMIAENIDYSDEPDELLHKSQDSAAGDEVLYKLLKSTNKSIAKKHKVPPFVVFPEASLEEMATNYPSTIEDLCQINGVGQGKAKKYGAEMLKIINAYIEENDIERPSEVQVKTAANKSKLKIQLIQSIDRKLFFDEIEKILSLNTNDLLTELEAIVSSGTKIDIDYYVNSVVEEDNYDDIYDYFMEEATSDSLEEALKDLEEYYTEFEVRLVRLKFLSDLGN